ncbi:MAG TPA: hypothetical protein DDZ51_24430 [Planctomycetaceae bacterium]|nr:hypothetical protein [Planctomycetaceae bacterium]
MWPEGNSISNVEPMTWVTRPDVTGAVTVDMRLQRVMGKKVSDTTFGSVTGKRDAGSQLAIERHTIQ